MSNWYEEFFKKIKAIEAMPPEDVDSGFNFEDLQNFLPTQDLTQPTNNPPLVMNNKHMIKLPGAEFIVELIPQIVSDPTSFGQSNNAQQSVEDENNEILNQTEGGNPYPEEDKDVEDPIEKKEIKQKTKKVNKKRASLDVDELRNKYREMLGGDKVKSEKKDEDDKDDKKFPKPFLGGAEVKQEQRDNERNVKDDPRDIGGDQGMSYMSHRPR